MSYDDGKYDKRESQKSPLQPFISTCTDLSTQNHAYILLNVISFVELNSICQQQHAVLESKTFLAMELETDREVQ